jgi:hypothetical protein
MASEREEPVQSSSAIQPATLISELAIVENYFRFACYLRSIRTTDRILIWNVTGMITRGREIRA